MQQFARTTQKTANFLNRGAQLGIPLVGIDLALVLVLYYRDEYQHMLADRRGNFLVYLVHEWLQEALSFREPTQQQTSVWYLFGHCTEITALPNSVKQWQNIFAYLGEKLESVSVGCCGMAGTYGHESKNLENSLRIYALSWQQVLHKLPHQRCLAISYSCRSQVKRVEGYGLRHPLQALLEII